MKNKDNVKLDNITSINIAKIINILWTLLNPKLFIIL